MPKVAITKEQEQLNRIYNDIHGQMFRKGITQRRIAQELGITQQAVSIKLKHQTLSLLDYVTIKNILEEAQ